MIYIDFHVVGRVVLVLIEPNIHVVGEGVELPVAEVVVAAPGLGAQGDVGAVLHDAPGVGERRLLVRLQPPHQLLHGHAGRCPCILLN